MRKNTLFFSVLVVFLLIAGCLNVPPKDYYTAMELHEISADYFLNSDDALLKNSTKFKIGDIIKLRDKVEDIKVINKTTAICFLDKYEDMYYDDLLAGAYAGDGFAVFSNLTKKVIKVGDIVEITFTIIKKKINPIDNREGLFIEFNVDEDNITVISYTINNFVISISVLIIGCIGVLFIIYLLKKKRNKEG